MAKERPPSFQFYPRDFLSSAAVAAMTPEERGGYINLLCHAWLSKRAGWLPDDDALLARLSDLRDRWQECRDGIARAWRVRRGWWVQPRMVATRRAQMSFSRERSRSGKAGNQVRWSQRDESLGNRSAIAKHRSSSASSSASAFAVEKKQPPSSPDGDGRAGELPLDDPDREESPREWDEGFDPFWEEYPRKVAKAAARAAYARLRPRSQRNYDLLMDGLRLHIRKEWYGRDPDKIPHASTWLNQRRFTDAESEA